jgi:hypothetical protein
VELLENPSTLLLRDASAGIHHTDRKVSIDSFGAQANLTCIGELDGIANEIEQNLRKSSMPEGTGS